MQVSFFSGGITQVIPTKDANIVGILEAIKNGFWRNKIETLRNCQDEESKEILKKALPYFTCSGTFKKREDKSLVSYSGLIQLDFDNLQEPRQYRRVLQGDDFIFSFFISPSGNGIKIITKVENNPSRHTANFWGLYGYFLGRYNLKADPKVFVLSMPFFVSYDPDLYLNTESKIWTMK